MQTIIPKPLKKGDTIGLIAPSFAFTEEQLKNGIENLHKIGFKTVYSEIALKKYGYFAGTDQERAKDMIRNFEDKNIDAIMCIRGGYGASRIANLLDYNIIKQNPKQFIGYSDITFLQNAILKKTGLVTLHGLTAACNYNSFSLKSLEDMLFSKIKNYTLPYKREPNTEELEEFNLYTINKGEAEGKLIGGNLSVLISMIGTKFAPSYKNKIVFIEDIDEQPYRIDRMLTQMFQSTDIAKASGIVFGVFRACQSTKQTSFSLKQAIGNIIKPTNIPASYGFSFGHITHKNTIPIGVKAYFNANKNYLKIIS